MKKTLILGLAMATALTGAAFADSLSVTAGAAQAGTNFGLQVSHTGGTSIAYVQDDTPASETIYRVEFIFEPNTVSVPGNASFRQPIFTALGPNPNPGVFACTQGLFVESIRIFWQVNYFGGNPVSSLQAETVGDGCGFRSSGNVAFINGGPGVDTNGNNNGAVKVCTEFERGIGTDAGKIRLGVVDDDQSCSTATLSSGNVTNNNVRVDFARMGTPQMNQFGLGETATLFFDEFASFRTLAP